MGQTVGSELVSFQESLSGPSHFSLFSRLHSEPVPDSRPFPTTGIKGREEKGGKGLGAEWGFWSDVEFTWNAPGYFGKTDILGKQ